MLYPIDISEESAEYLIRSIKRMTEENRNSKRYKYDPGEYATVRSTGPIDITNKKGVIVTRSHEPSYQIMVKGKLYPVLENQLRPKETEAESSWRFNVGDTVRVRDDCSYVYASVRGCKGTIVKRCSDRKYSVRIDTAHYYIQEDNLVKVCKTDFKQGEIVNVVTKSNRTALVENIYKDLDGRPMYKIRMKDNINELFVCNSDSLRHLKQHEIDELKRPFKIGDVVSRIGNFKEGVVEHIYKDNWGFTNYVVRLRKETNGIKRVVYLREQLERVSDQD